MNYPYRKFFDEKIKELVKCRRVLDLGGGARFQKQLARYRDLFKDLDYKTMDIEAAFKPDLIGDIHNIPIADNSIDGIICLSVLEHVEDPLRAVSEIFRILRPQGRGLIYIPSIYPYHARKNSYRDYWRFFDDTIRLMFKNFSKIEICRVGGYFRALSFFFPWQVYFQKILEPLAFLLDKLFRTNNRTTTSGYYIYVEK